MDVAFLLDKYFKGAKKVSIDVFDAQTLNTVYKDVINSMTSHFEIEVSVLQALSYSDGKGLGFGLYTTSRLVDSIGKEFILHSGNHKLVRKDGAESVVENGYWQGTLIFMVIDTTLKMSLDELKRSTTFKGLNPLAERSVLVALQRRYKVISETL